jgi:hypothetical protein
MVSMRAGAGTAEAPDWRLKTKRTREFPLFQWVDFSWRAIPRLMQGAPDADQKRGESRYRVSDEHD